MLYITTRDKSDAFTAARTLSGNLAQDGGLYVPFRLPQLTRNEIYALKEQSFGQTVAQILNQFFASRLTGWDVDFAIGRYPAKFVSMKHKMIVAELWHNPGSGYSYIVKKLFDRICLFPGENMQPTEWATIAVRIAVLAALYGEMLRSGVADLENPIDIAASAEDFALPMAVWYARQMGFPFGALICGCNSGSGLWDLLQRGEYSTSLASDKMNLALERLIQGTLGCREVQRYVDCCNNKKTYVVSEADLETLNKGIYVAVVEDFRIHSVISSVLNTRKYCLNRSSAFAYSALQDYRAGVSENRTTLLLADSADEN